MASKLVYISANFNFSSHATLVGIVTESESTAADARAVGELSDHVIDK